MKAGKYFRAAFTRPWHLLVLGAAAAVALISGAPADVSVPLIMAGEIAYLGYVGTHPKFRQKVDAESSRQEQEAGSKLADQELWRMMKALPSDAMRRFQTLRQRCLELRNLGEQIRRHQGESSGQLDDFQTQGLDRLLWIFLRLLYSRHSLQQFLGKTNGERIQAEIADLESRLAQVDTIKEYARDRVRETLADNLQTCRDRLENLQKAQDSAQILELELDRLEAKIQALSEMSINRQEPDFISGQIDQVATSMVETEKTMNDLRFATGLPSAPEEVPALLKLEKAAVVE